MNICFQPVFDSCCAELGVSRLRLRKNEVLSDSHVFSHVIVICHFRTSARPTSLSDISYLASLSARVLSSLLRLSLPNFLYTYFHLSLHVRQTLTAPPSQYNEIESSQIERSHFYSCQLIIEETDSCSTQGKRGGSDGEMGGFCRGRLPGELGQELFSTQNSFFSLSRSFWYFCPLVQPWSFFPLSVNAFKAAPAFIFKSMWVFQEFIFFEEIVILRWCFI